MGSPGVLYMRAAIEDSFESASRFRNATDESVRVCLPWIELAGGEYVIEYRLLKNRSTPAASTNTFH
jgi:hypothetical protein